MRPFKPEKLFLPRDFAHPSINPQSNQLALEIGAGVGLHAITYAKSNPNTHLLAIERTQEKFQKFNHSAIAANLSNLSAIHADAIAWTVHALPAQCLNAIFILYPNPEPKNPAQRWLNMPFFAFLLSRLKAAGTITLASNMPVYIAEAITQLNTVWHLPFVHQMIDESIASVGRTHFEIKYLQRSEPCSQLIITKPENYTTNCDTWHADNPLIQIVS